MLQGRLFSYGDAQRYRLGVNHWQIPVNQPKGVGIENLCPFSRDGQMRVVDNNQGGEHIIIQITMVNLILNLNIKATIPN